MTFISFERYHRINRGMPAATAILLAGIIALPVVSVMVLAVTPSDDIWSHLLSTVLPRYLTNTILLTVAVGALAGIVGTVAAWLVTLNQFPFRRTLSWMLFLPLAVPAYIGAYALVDFFEYAGPLQSSLRAIFGWSNSNEYFFPEIRSLGGAIIILSAALYPYVYLLVRMALREQSMLPHDVARTLGAGPIKRFFKVTVSLARPSITAGIALVMMETASDFGVVEYFAVQTLTTGIFSIWLDARNVGGAAQLALLVMVLMAILVAVERTNRRRMRFSNASNSFRVSHQKTLHGLKAFIAVVFCVIPVVVGFFLPIGVVMMHALGSMDHWVDSNLLQALTHTVFTGATAAFIAMIGAVIMVYSAQISIHAIPRILTPFSTLGYAIPGAVIGLGLLLPLAYTDHLLADLLQWLTGIDVGLVLTGSAFAVILAYCVRFFAVAHGAADSAIGRVSPSLGSAARSLGKSPSATLFSVHLPLIRSSLLTGLVLVFVDCVKELPATLLLRPFDFNTLATRVYERASLENLPEAAPAALLVTLVGSVGVLWLARAK